MTLKEFFYKLVNNEISPDTLVNVGDFEQIKCIDLSKSINPPMNTTQTSPDCKIIELTSKFGKNVHYHLHNDGVQYSNLDKYDKYKNGFDIIMQSSQNKQFYVPNFSYSSKSNRKQLLRHDIVKLIQNHKIGWSTQESANNEGKQFIISLSEALWYIDMCDYTKLKERGYDLPTLFHEFLGRANPESYKATRKQFDINELDIHCQSLIPYLSSSWIRSSNFSWLYTALNDLVITISNYTKYLCKQRDVITSNHTKETPVRSIEKATSVNIYKKHLPKEPMQCLHFIQGLSQVFTFKIREYCYSSGNNAYNVISIWKIDENATQSKIVQEMTRITRELQNEASLYHTHIMRANFMCTCDLLLPMVKPAPLRTIYRMLTGDMSAAESANEKKEHNEGRPEKYNAFWEAAARFLSGKAADLVTAVDE
ncbi:3551_t:CDS:2 [Scutellospora calospora]|uniref:3551_t:CDS:1 n=1 Tax=Scutellospora calospora TaxID=85575 RepID=A0ACA9K024_9GLOM|nr:3551_t:CDS:2 [Scutellospora calospora]